jgi:hypothetical protein
MWLTAGNANHLDLVRTRALERDVVLLGIPECTGFLGASRGECFREEEDGDGLAKDSVSPFLTAFSGSVPFGLWGGCKGFHLE